jgi:hypothetical protein
MIDKGRYTSPPPTRFNTLAHSHLSLGDCLINLRIPRVSRVIPYDTSASRGQRLANLTAEAGNHFIESMLARVNWLMIEIVALEFV